MVFFDWSIHGEVLRFATFVSLVLRGCGAGDAFALHFC
jgi:hypothetical protein